MKKKEINWNPWIQLGIVFGILIIIAVVVILVVKPCIPCGLKVLTGG